MVKRSETHFTSHGDVEKYDSLLNGSSDFIVESDRAVRLSNSALELPKWDHDIDLLDSSNANPVLSLDRISMVLKSPVLVRRISSDEAFRESVFEKIHAFLKQQGLIKSVAKQSLEDGDYVEDDLSVNSTANYFYHFRLEGGIDLQLFPKKMKRKKFKSSNSDLERELIEEYGYEMNKIHGEMWVRFYQECFARFEWTPSKCDPSDQKAIYEFLGLLIWQYEGSFDLNEDVLITRYDLAIDYRRYVPLHQLMHTSISTSNYKCSKTNGFETVYFGNSRSDLSICCYNKKLEVKRKENLDVEGEWYRIEARCKKTVALGKVKPEVMGRCFDFFYMTNLFSGKIDWKQEFFNHYAQTYGVEAALDRMPKQTRSRYRKILVDNSTHLHDHPNVVSGMQVRDVWNEFLITLKNLFRTTKVENNYAV